MENGTAHRQVPFYGHGEKVISGGHKCSPHRDLEHPDTAVELSPEPRVTAAKLVIVGSGGYKKRCDEIQEALVDKKHIDDLAAQGLRAAKDEDDDAIIQNPYGPNQHVRVQLPSWYTAYS